PYNVADLSKKLDKQNVFDIRFYPIILFFYGVITLKDKYYMAFPDKIMRNILLA
ncbi:AAA family ATPase, partial [Bacteroides xylanisolvens]